MTDFNFQKPARPKVDIGDTRIFLLGITNWAEKNGEEFLLGENFDELMGPYRGVLNLSEALEPFSPERCMDILDLAVSESDPNLIADMPEELIEAMKQRYADLGMSAAFDDGVITVEELVMAASARGNAALDQNPRQYNLTEEQIAHAEKFLAKHGIDDPDGDIARGFAVQSVRVAQRANEGLGIANNSQPELSTKHTMPTAEVSVSAPTLG